jgi:hypothetical protein
MIRNVRRFVAVVPAVTMALISHAGVCPACWPLIGGLMSSLGVTFLIETRYLLPLMIGCLALAVAALSYGDSTQLPPVCSGYRGFWSHLDREVRARRGPCFDRWCVSPRRRIRLEFLVAPTE